MQLETTHLSGSPCFNEAFAARMSPPAAPAPTLRLQCCTGQSRWGQQWRESCWESFSSMAKRTGVRRTSIAELWKGSLVFLKLCFCGLLPRCTRQPWQPTLGSSGRNNSTYVFESVSSCLSREGKSNTILGDSRWQNDNYRVTFRRQSWMRQRKHTGTCCDTAQFLSDFNRAIKKPSSGSKNLIQKSHHGIPPALPSNKQWIIRRDTEIIFRGINFRGLKILTILSGAEVGVNEQPHMISSSLSPLLEDTGLWFASCHGASGAVFSWWVFIWQVDSQKQPCQETQKKKPPT